MRTSRNVLAVAIAGIVLASCSGGDDPDGPAAATEATSDDTATTPDNSETTGEPTTGEPTTVTSTTAAPTTTVPPATTAAPTTTVPAWTEPEPGPYDVGVATIELPDADRPLTVDVWFPLDTTVDLSTLPPQQYTLLPGVFYESPDAVAADAAAIADAEDEAGFPLVVYSHGSGGLRYIHSIYTEALAANGYVVAAPDHTGNTALDLLLGSDLPAEEIAILRPEDVRRVIDAFVDADDPNAGPFAQHVDADRIAVTGHSFGGYTAIATVAGASVGDIDVPADDRVDAIVPLAPAVAPNWLPDDLLATIDVPMMVLVGSDDRTTPPDPNVTRLWADTEGSGAEPAYRIELTAAEHQTFTDLCSYQAALGTLDDVPEIVVQTIDDYAAEGCSPGDMPADRAAAITNGYVVGFLDQVFRDGPSFAPEALIPPDDAVVEVR
jgi:predicted dienelactone hydrolase